MTLPEFLALALTLTIIFTVVSGYPVAFMMAGVSLAFAMLGVTLGAFDMALLMAYPQRVYGAVMRNETLLAIPLFVFLGHAVAKTGISERMLTALASLMGHKAGGLSFGVLLVGTMLSVSSGVAGGIEVAMGLIAMPAMLKARYHPALAAGTICASSTLAQLIPPSTVLILAADLMQGVVLRAQLEAGMFTLPPVSVGDVFAGAIVPSMVLVVIYAIGLAIVAWRKPHLCPPIPIEHAHERATPRQLLITFAPPLVLMFIVLGSVLGGISTATEAAALGSLGVVLMAIVQRTIDWPKLLDIGYKTAMTTATMMIVIMAASLFSLVFRGFGGEHIVESFLRHLPGGLFGAMFFLMVLVFLLGFFIDTFEILLLTIPVFGLPLVKMGADPVWLCVMLGINLQTSFMTPPFGYALFYMRASAPPSVATRDIWLGALPFVGLQLLTLCIVWAFPQLVTGLAGGL